MNYKNALVIGIGYVGIRLAKELVGLGLNVYGSSRDTRKLKTLENFGAKPIIWDENSPTNINLKERKIKIIISTVPPNRDGDDPILKGINNELKKFDGWIGYISSTSVYGGKNNILINEKSKCLPNTERGKVRLKIEKEWHDHGAEIFRAAGIYGESRSPFDKLNQRETVIIKKDNHVFNRIHIDDLIGIILNSMSNPLKKRIINAADGNPSSQIDFFMEAARIAKTSMPKIVNFDEVQMSGLRKSFWLYSKHIKSSAHSKDFNYTFKFQDYQSGLKAIWDKEKKLKFFT